MSSKSELFVVATPIGNPDDITVRALKVLREVDFVICEEYKFGSRFLKRYDINKPLEILNEHNESEHSQEILQRLARTGESAALISDAGTPLFADPGNKLVSMCHQHGIVVTALPGACSLIAALMVSGINTDSFWYYGFLPANSSKRKKELKKLPDDQTIVFLDTPYRLRSLLKDMKSVLGEKRKIILAYKLTYPNEKLWFGNLKEMSQLAEDLPKGEFVLILERA
jgi:16S rRNA (cytidine1402-2'-O)-methyltransferase